MDKENKSQSNLLNYIPEFIGFMMPIIGLIIWIVIRTNNPVKASSVAHWSRIGFVVGFLMSFIRIALRAMF